MQSLCAVGLVMQWRCLLKLLLGLAPPLYQKPTFQVVAILDRILLCPRAGEIELRYKQDSKLETKVPNYRFYNFSKRIESLMRYHHRATVQRTGNNFTFKI